MQARQHTIIGAVAATALIPFLGINSAIFWAAAVLIDGDHYTEYVYRNGFRDFSIKRMFWYYELLRVEEKYFSHIPVYVPV